FTSQHAGGDDDGYAQTADEMISLAQTQAGFLGVETSGRDAAGFAITVSYWRDQASIRGWRDHADHRSAQRAGRTRWYRAYRLRIAEVHESRSFDAPRGEAPTGEVQRSDDQDLPGPSKD